MTKTGDESTARIGAEIASQAGAGAEPVEVAEATHGRGDEALAGDGECGDDQDAGPGANNGGAVRHPRELQP